LTAPSRLRRESTAIALTRINPTGGFSPNAHANGDVFVTAPGIDLDQCSISAAMPSLVTGHRTKWPGGRALS